MKLGSSGACRRVHFALFEFLHLGKDGAGEADNYWYLLPAIRERRRDVYRGGGSISTLLIRNSPSALCSLNKRSHSLTEHAHTRHKLQFYQAVKQLAMPEDCYTLDFAPLRRSSNIWSLHTVNEWAEGLYRGWVLKTESNKKQSNEEK